MRVDDDGNMARATLARAIGATLCATLCAAANASFAATDASHASESAPHAGLVAPPLAAQQPSISVGRNVQVSRARESEAHGEVLIGADPNDASRLVACSMVFSAEKNKRYTVVYASFDGGANWEPTLTTADYEASGDPTCAYGPDGTAYYAAIVTQPDDLHFVHSFRSADGGRTWDPPAIVSRRFDGLDREYLTVDTTDSPYRGRVYVSASGWGRFIDGDSMAADMSVFRSLDGGRTYNGPAKRISRGDDYVLGVGNGAVLSNGTLVVVFGELREYEIGGENRVQENRPARSNASLHAMASTDGGESFEGAVKVADFYMDWPPWSTSAVPTIAVDPGSERFEDRLYVVWPDLRSGRLEIYLSYSSDKGESWSLPVRVNDDRPPASPEQTVDHFMPSVAVNQEGVVGVAWYDRRDHPDNRGWTTRFTASLDGGATFLPSVPVAQAPTRFGNETWGVLASANAGQGLGLRVYLNGFHFNGGHTAGMAAAEDGRFFPLWVDNRTGLPQVWTAPVTVSGAVFPNGSPELAGLTDVSDRVTLQLSNVRYDRSTDVISLDARLENTSDEPLATPLLVRVLQLSSDLGVPEILDSDNGGTGPGAVLDFSDLIPAPGLATDEASEVKRLRFRLTNLRPFFQDGELKPMFISVDARVLGPSQKGSEGSEGGAR